MIFTATNPLVFQHSIKVDPIVYVMTMIIIIIISIFKEDKVFSIIASLPYGPPVNTDIDYYRIVYFCSVAMLVVRYC